MPTDLLIAVTVMVACSAILSVIAFQIARRSRRRGTIVAVLAVVLLAAHATWLKDNPSLSKMLPIADLIVWGNLVLPAASVLAGSVAALMRAPRWQRIIFPSILIAIGLWRLVAPLFGPPPALGPDRWIDGICRQSTTRSCSAAAAATLLRRAGIAAGEAEMCGLCLTHTDGTSNLGLYRGLVLKARSVGQHITAGHPSIDQIKHWRSPVLMNIGLPGQSRWAIGGRHSIVLLDWDAEHIDVADPFGGRQTWSWQDLAACYAGEAFAITR